MFYTCEVQQSFEDSGGRAVGVAGMRQLRFKIKADDSADIITQAREKVKKLNNLKRWEYWGQGGHKYKVFHHYYLTDITHVGENVFRSYLWP